MKPDVSFIVLNWHDEAETLTCLESIRALKGDYTKQIIVVDNESTPQSVATLSASDCEIVQNAQNLGFAGGVNSALPRIRGTYVAFVNNDAVLAKNWLDEALKIMRTFDQVGIVGGKEFHWDANNPKGSVDNDFTAPSVIHPEKGYTQRVARALPMCEVPFLTGSNMLMPSRLFRQLKGFDSDFFAYYEDADLGLRTIARGYKLIYAPQLHAWHKRNLTSNKIPYKKLYLPTRNRMIFIAKHFPDTAWRSMLRKGVLDAIATAILGVRGGLRSMLHGNAHNVGRMERKALMAAACWTILHYPTLERKRAATKKRGEYNSDLSALLKRLQDNPKDL